MRAVPTTGGIELGPQEGPWLDIVPLVPLKEREGALLARASRLARLPGRRSAWESPQRALSPAPPELQGATGLLGEQPLLLVMFRWWRWQAPAQAIAIIEQAKGGLPLGLACACLAAARAGRRLQRAPALAAAVAEAIYGEAVAATHVPKAEEIEDLARRLAKALAAGTAPPDPGSASGIVRMLTRASRLLWHEEGARAASMA